MTKDELISYLRRHAGGYSVPGVDNHNLAKWLEGAPAAPAPHPLQALTEACEDEQNAIDAERYRWLRDAENGSGPSAGMLEDWKDGGWERVHWYYEDELDAAIDAAIEAGKGEQA